MNPNDLKGGTMKPNPSYSAGARYERKALRTYLERQVLSNGAEVNLVTKILKWVRTRQSRYDKRPGGL
jgi:hypothetical protein